MIFWVLMQVSSWAQGTGSSADRGMPVEVTRRFGLVLVKAAVNGTPATLVMDTGASNTILSAKLVRVRMPPQEHVPEVRKGSGFIGTASWTRATIKLGDSEWRDHEFLVMNDFPEISNSIGQQVDGILGQDVLKSFSAVEIDFKHRRLILSR